MSTPGKSLQPRVPSYRCHKASGQAVVTVAGKDRYLGTWKSRESRDEYKRVIGEWLAAGCPTHPVAAPSDLTITELAIDYFDFAKLHYVYQGRQSKFLGTIKSTLRTLRKTYGNTLAVNFGPLALKAMQMQFVEAGLSRRYVNKLIDLIRRMFKWAVSEERLPPAVYQALRTVDGLRKGRSNARETKPIAPIDDATVNATLPHLSSVVADMVRLQRLTGARPDEICILRPCDIEREGEVWSYQPSRHKTERHGHGRCVYIGPEGQKVLRPYLDRAPDAYCFSPLESERARRAEKHKARKTPLSCGNRPGSNRVRRPGWRPGEAYTTDSYRRAIYRACALAFPAPEHLSDDDRAKWRRDRQWHPNQLRHSRATEIRKKFGLEAAQVTLGHAKADVTQVYAERDLALAAKIARETG